MARIPFIRPPASSPPPPGRSSPKVLCQLPTGFGHAQITTGHLLLAVLDSSDRTTTAMTRPHTERRARTLTRGLPGAEHGVDEGALAWIRFDSLNISNRPSVSQGIGDTEPPRQATNRRHPPPVMRCDQLLVRCASVACVRSAVVSETRPLSDPMSAAGGEVSICLRVLEAWFAVGCVVAPDCRCD